MAVILLYHGVTDIPAEGIENYSGKHIGGNAFFRQMLYLKLNHQVVSLDHWLEHREDDAVMITFDDSYENVMVNAAPILFDLKFPWTFYVTAGMVNTDLMYWTDRIEAALNHTTRKSIFGYRIASREGKIVAANALKQKGKTLNRYELNRFVAGIEDSLAVNTGVMLCDNYRNVTWRQLEDAYGGHLTIGGHGLYHDILGYMSDPEQFTEIKTSICLLERNLGWPVRHYSYPEGQEEHFNNDTISALKENHIKACPTAIHGTNDARTDPFNLRRVMVGFNGEPFPWTV